MNKLTLTLMAATMVLASCTKQMQEFPSDQPSQQNTLAAKLVGGTDGDIVPGTMLVKLDEQATNQILDGGFAEVNAEIFSDIDVRSFTRALPVNPKILQLQRNMVCISGSWWSSTRTPQFLPQPERLQSLLKYAAFSTTSW